jgi:hypothetical protein
MMFKGTLFPGFLGLFISSLIVVSCPAQDDQSIRFVFYNVENLFDVEDDSLTTDEEFTPEGAKAWTLHRYYEKIDRIARTLTAVGGWHAPALVGLCEIENREVLFDLTTHRLLETSDLDIIHKDSPDDRGIDVALLYRPDKFSPVASVWIPVDFDEDPDMHTRDILYVKGILFNDDTLHIFINHWPSRWGGVETTLPKRVKVAATLRKYTDSLFMLPGNPNIIIAGDLNDNPVDSSVCKVLGALEVVNHDKGNLYNLMFPAYLNQHEGSLKYKADWEVYDQIIVSSSLLNDHGLRVKHGQAHILSAPFLLEDDKRYLGKKPYRTYAGPSYLNGFSDHLPVYIDLIK